MPHVLPIGPGFESIWPLHLQKCIRSLNSKIDCFFHLIRTFSWVPKFAAASTRPVSGSVYAYVYVSGTVHVDGNVVISAVCAGVSDLFLLPGTTLPPLGTPARVLQPLQLASSYACQPYNAAHQQQNGGCRGICNMCSGCKLQDPSSQCPASSSASSLWRLLPQP